MGRLFETAAGSSTTEFLYDGGALVAEYDGSGNLQRRYVHGPGVDEPLIWYEGSGLGTRRYLRADHLGSVVAVTNAAGASFAINTYDEYGKRGSGNTGRFQYTGQILISELGLYYYKARMYSPVLGRFMQTDPIGYKDQMNIYAYGHNDPVNRLDPSGETDIYVGGVGDSTTHIVQNYANSQAQSADRTVGYFEQGDKDGIVDFAKANADNGEPLNIIGHSYGASTAISATKELAKGGIKVDNLVGVDGVKKPFHRDGLGKAKSSVGNVVSVNATGKGTVGDVIESVGKGLGSVTTMGGGTPTAFKAGNANVSITTDVSHANFAGAFTAAGSDGLSAKDIVDSSYQRLDK